VTMYQGMADEGRVTYKANLAEAIEARKKLAAKAGLTGEMATEGEEVRSTPDKNPVVLAAKRMGMA
jgi:hypothetical protein